MTLMQSQCAHTQSDLSGPMLEASLQIFISPLHDCIAATEFGVLYDNLYTRFLGFVVGIAAALLHVRHAEVLRVWFHGSKLCIPMTLVATFAVLYPFVEQFLINDTQIRLISSRIIAHPMLNFGLGFWILSPTSRFWTAQSMDCEAAIEPSALCHRAAFLLDVSLSHPHHLGGVSRYWSLSGQR